MFPPPVVFAARAFLPTAVLSFPEVFDCKVLVPHPVFDDPVLAINALKPRAVLLLPVKLASKAALPTATLFVPVVSFESALYQTATV